MKGDKGTCIAGDIPNQVRRTKFDTEKHALEAMNTHIELGFIAPNYVVYKCKECSLYHFGKPEWKEIFSI
jgi:hypothetical protein